MTRQRAQQITRLLADRTRFEIFGRIAKCRDEMACVDLRSCLKITAATLSHHLKELADAGLVEARREAKYVHLKVNQKTWKDYLGHLKKLV